MAAFTLSSYDNGPVLGGAGNRTGSNGSTANCSTGGCHASNNAATVLSLVLLDGVTPVTDGKYIPGKTYHVLLGGTVANANLPKFGFQLSCVKTATTSAQAGTWALAGATLVASRTSGGLPIMEHTAPIDGTGAGNTWAYTKQFDWTAPAAGTGSVTFYLTLNAVNNSGTTGGDQPNNKTFAFAEGSVGIETIAPIVVSSYPNPVTDQLHISLGNASGSYSIVAYDMIGKTVHTGSINGSETTISTQNWTNGIYYIKVAKDGAEKVIAVVKQ